MSKYSVEIATEANPVMALFGGAIGALVGAVVWALIAYATGYEIAYIAIGVGIAVGYGAAALGGQSGLNGILAAGLAFMAILTGKYIAIGFYMNHYFDEQINRELTAAAYNEMRYDSEGAALIDPANDAQLNKFMVDHKFTQATSPDQITGQERDFFRNVQYPEVIGFKDKYPSEDIWRAEIKAEAKKEFNRSVDKWQALQDSFEPIDLLFYFIGVGAAFSLAKGGQE
jgi:hypothetical protein